MNHLGRGGLRGAVEIEGEGRFVKKGHGLGGGGGEIGSPALKGGDQKKGETKNMWDQGPANFSSIGGEGLGAGGGGGWAFFGLKGGVKEGRG